MVLLKTLTSEHGLVENPDLPNGIVENPDLPNGTVENPDLQNGLVENCDLPNGLVGNPIRTLFDGLDWHSQPGVNEAWVTIIREPTKSAL